jgi:hypothetical protein
VRCIIFRLDFLTVLPPGPFCGQGRHSLPLFTLWTGQTRRPTKDLYQLGRGSPAIDEVEAPISNPRLLLFWKSRLNLSCLDSWQERRARTRDLCRDSTKEPRNYLKLRVTDGIFWRSKVRAVTLIGPLSDPRPLPCKPLPNLINRRFLSRSVTDNFRFEGALWAVLGVRPCPYSRCHSVQPKGANAPSFLRVDPRIGSFAFRYAPDQKIRKKVTRHLHVGPSDAYPSWLAFATSCAITDARLVVPATCSVPGTPK